MTSFPTRLTLAGFALSFATAAIGQSGDWYVTPSLIYNNDDAYRAIDDSLSGFQISVGRNLTERLTLEGLLGYSDIPTEPCAPVDCFPGQRHSDVGFNLLAYLDRESVSAPYLLFGVGYLNVNPESGTDFTRGSGETAATASGGLGFK